MKIPPYVADVIVIGSAFLDRLEACPEHVREAGERLICDERMKRLWETRLTGEMVLELLHEFEIATDRDHWSGKTQREREAWASKFERTVEAILELMESAPTTAESFGFPARDAVLMNVAYRMGVEMPEPDDLIGHFAKMRELEEAADAECWTLADSLKHYREQIRADCKAEQPLKKPGDPLAGRAQFIVMVKRHFRFSAQEVATIATVVFNCADVSDRLVRRLTQSRTDSCES